MPVLVCLLICFSYDGRKQSPATTSFSLLLHAECELQGEGFFLGEKKKREGGVKSLMNERRQKSHITSHVMVLKRFHFLSSTPHVGQLQGLVQGFLVLSFFSVVLFDFNYDALIFF